MFWKKILQRLFGARQPEAAPKPAKRREPYRWNAELSFDSVAFGGSVPSDAIRKSFAEIAEARPGRKVADHMELSAGPPDGWEAAARCALDALASLRSGRVFVGNNRLTIEGVALDDAGLARLKALRGGKGDRGFSVSASGVTPPIPAAPMGPPPPEAAPVVAEDKKPRKKAASRSKRNGTAKAKTGSAAAAKKPSEKSAEKTSGSSRRTASSKKGSASKTKPTSSRRASSRPAKIAAEANGDAQETVIAPPPAKKPRRASSGRTAKPSAETPAPKSD